jgi:hypothetical protein
MYAEQAPVQGEAETLARAQDDCARMCPEASWRNHFESFPCFNRVLAHKWTELVTIPSSRSDEMVERPWPRPGLRCGVADDLGRQACSKL